MKRPPFTALGAAAALFATLATGIPAMCADAGAATVDVGNFGTDQPVERKDLPARGVITFGPKDFTHMPASHWEQWDWKFTAKRWGSYQVRLTYKLRAASLPVQFKIGKLGDEIRLKESLPATAGAAKTIYLGKIRIPEAGESPFALYAPTAAANAGFEIQEMAFIPAPESDDKLAQAEDGTITLLAKDATTWSTNMRYEPKPEKNCLGFWTEADDIAEWEFKVAQPGKYKVSVFHGCGGGNHGSKVAVKSGDQTVKFTVQDTGGFQKWQEVQAGEIEIRAAGTNRLVIDPEDTTKSAVLDVQKVILTPVG